MHSHLTHSDEYWHCFLGTEALLIVRCAIHSDSIGGGKGNLYSDSGLYPCGTGVHHRLEDVTVFSFVHMKKWWCKRLGDLPEVMVSS